MDLAPDLHELGWCPFAAVTGRPCILCGGTRAVLAVARGDLVAAWHFNAWVLVFGVVATVGLTIEALRGGMTAVRARVHLLVTPPAGRSVHLPMVAFFVIWWAWDLARW